MTELVWRQHPTVTSAGQPVWLGMSGTEAVAAAHCKCDAAGWFWIVRAACQKGRADTDEEARRRASAAWARWRLDAELLANPQMAALDRAVIDAATAWVDEDVGEHRPVHESLTTALFDAVRAWQRAGAPGGQTMQAARDAGH